MSFCMKTAEMCFQKHAPTLEVAMVTKGWRRWLKFFFFCKLVHLSCEKVSSPCLRHSWDFAPPPFFWIGVRHSCVISSKIVGPGELFSFDFRACAWNLRWATPCSPRSVSCSFDAYAEPRSAVRKRAPPVMSSPRSEQQRTWLIFAKKIEIFQVKAWLATFKSIYANPYSCSTIVKKRKQNSSIDLHRAFTSASVDRSSISSASIAAGLFPNVPSLVPLCCGLQQKLSAIDEVCLFFWLHCAEPHFFQGRWKRRRITVSMARQSSDGSARGWLV